MLEGGLERSTHELIAQQKNMSENENRRLNWIGGSNWTIS